MVCYGKKIAAEDWGSSSPKAQTAPRAVKGAIGLCSTIPDPTCFSQLLAEQGLSAAGSPLAAPKATPQATVWGSSIPSCRAWVQALRCTGTGMGVAGSPSLRGGAVRKGGTKTPHSPPWHPTRRRYPSAVPSRPLLPPPRARPMADGCHTGVCRWWPQPLHQSLICMSWLHVPVSWSPSRSSSRSQPSPPVPMSAPHSLSPLPLACTPVPLYWPWPRPQPGAGFG